jgi:hypothetical protein
MKTIYALFGIVGLLAFAGLAQAETVTLLQSPPRVVTTPGWACEGISFDAGDNVHGYCQQTTSRSAGGRGGNTVYTSTVYEAVWNTSGLLLSNVECGVATQHGPTITWVYVPSYSAANCAQPGGNVGPFVLIGNYWYTITATSTDGAYETAASNSGPVVIAF